MRLPIMILKPKEINVIESTYELSELIRCEDCKNWHSTGGTDKERKGWCSVWKSKNYSKTDDYCSYAERMESDEE